MAVINEEVVGSAGKIIYTNECLFELPLLPLFI